jgi:N-acylneuraminate cytidylyltransferase
MVVSVKETKSNPYYVLFEENESGFLVKKKNSKITRRQEFPKVWKLNGAIYIIRVDALKEKN